MILSKYDLSIWDVIAQGWRRPQETIGVTVGVSSRNNRLRSTLHFNTYKPCPDLLLFSQYWTDVLSSTNCIKKNAN